MICVVRFQMFLFSFSFVCQLTKNVSEQWPHVTRHIPGTDETGGVTGLGAKLIIRLQFGRGQAIRWDELLQINKQLHGQRTYFLPGGAFRIGYKNQAEKDPCNYKIYSFYGFYGFYK